MYYYARNGQQFGPHSEEELRALVAQGKVGVDEPVWKQGMAAWAALRTVLDVSQVAPPPPPPAAAPAYQPPTAPGYAPPAYAPPPGYGAPQAMAPAAGVQKERLAYILLGVFLGTLGIHNFYAGYNGKAVAQLVIGLVGVCLLGIPTFAIWVWAIVEVCTVTADARGVPFR